MRVLILSHSSSSENLGGAERSMLEFLDQWRGKRPDVEFFVVSRQPRGHLQPELDRRGIPHLLLAFNSWVLPKRISEPEDVFRTAREDFTAIRAIERFIEEWDPDLVVSNTIVSPWAAVAAKLKGKPHVWFAHEYGDDHDFQLTRAQTFEDIGLMSDLVVASSCGLRDYLSEWIDDNRLDVLYPVIDVEHLERRAREVSESRLPFTSEAVLRVVCVARISQSKGQSKLVTAIAALRDRGLRVEAALVGSATPHDGIAIQKLIESLGIADQVWIVGEVENPHPIIASADVGIVVSESEGFGRATVEYMAAGKPIVAVNVGANPELVDHDATGMLVPPDDVRSLADALESYASDRGVREAHGKAARAKVQNEVARSHQVPELLTRLESISAIGSAPIARLPNLLASWLDLPATSLQYLTDAGATTDPRQTRAWKIGRLVVGGPRNAMRMIRSRGKSV